MTSPSSWKQPALDSSGERNNSSITIVADPLLTAAVQFNSAPDNDTTCRRHVSHVEETSYYLSNLTIEVFLLTQFV